MSGQVSELYIIISMVTKYSLKYEKKKKQQKMYKSAETHSLVLESKQQPCAPMTHSM